MKWKTLFAVDAIASLAIALFITVKGITSNASVNGGFVCLGITRMYECNIQEVVMQTLILFIIAFIAISLIIISVKLSLVQKGITAIKSRTYAEEKKHASKKAPKEAKENKKKRKKEAEKNNDEETEYNEDSEKGANDGPGINVEEEPEEEIIRI